MTNQEDFAELVSNAYQNLYDFVQLRNHELAELLIQDDDTLDRKERGWRLHHLLLSAVEELYPGPSAPPFSREWRRHRLMVLRYGESMDAQAVADQLAISRRQYYREHSAAMEAVAALLWDRIQPAPPANPDTNTSPDPAQEDAMQRELARINAQDAPADLPEVLEGVLSVLDHMLTQTNIEVRPALPPDLPRPAIAHSLLRQVLLGALGVLLDGVTDTALHIQAALGEETLDLRLILADGAPLTSQAELAAHLPSLRELLQVTNAEISVLNTGQAGFVFRLNLAYDRTVLVVDDNEDMLALFRRYLTPNGYRVITTSVAEEALTLASQRQLDIIVLDLMMPVHDGWDLLQRLSTQENRSIPIVICSVLKQQALARSLGAAAYLAKPFSEQRLLAVLNGLIDELRDEATSHDN